MNPYPSTSSTSYRGYHRLYVPQLVWTTGDLNIHDIAVDAQGCPVFVKTLFICLATVSERHSFLPLWQPPFITSSRRKTAVT